MRARTRRASMVPGWLSVILVVSVLAACSPSNRFTTAAADGDIAATKRLLAKGKDVNGKDGWGWTPLHWASYYDRGPLAAYLLDSGADPNIVTTGLYGSVPEGSTALMIAAYYGHDGLVDLLLKSGADKSLKNSQGYTALRYATEYNFEPCVLLLSK